MNGIDRVFVSALNTVKRLPSQSSSPKPPLEDRLILYGLFKQSMEGDVPDSLLAALDEDPEDEEEHANREKIDAWAQQRGTTKTEAKKLYITTLIDSMRQYGSKTETAKALIDELEFVWTQVNGNNDGASAIHSRSTSGSISANRRRLAGQEQDMEEEDQDEDEDEEHRQEELARALPNVYRTAQNSPLKAIQPQRTGEANLATPSSLTLGNAPRGSSNEQDEKWKRQVEIALQQIRAELASVRESLLLTSPSSSSLFSQRHQSQSFLSVMLSRIYGILRITLTVAAYDALFLTVVWYIFRRRGDPRAKKVEEWVIQLWHWALTKSRVRMRRASRSIGLRR